MSKAQNILKIMDKKAKELKVMTNDKPMSEDKKTLREMLALSNSITDRLIEAGGEVTTEVEELISIRDISIPAKIDSYSFYMDKLKSDADYFKARAEFYNKIAKGCKGISERLKENIKYAMREEGKSELFGRDVRFKLSRSKPSLVIDEKRISQAYIHQVVEDVIDKKRIEEDLKLGVPVEGAILSENMSLRSYVNHSGTKKKTKKKSSKKVTKKEAKDV